MGYHVAYCVLGDREAAEDAAQEALARTYVHWSRASGNAEGWVARVAANQAIATLRRRRRKLAFVPSRTESPEASADRLALQAGLRSLSRRQREVVVLRYLADIPEVEVAAEEGCIGGCREQDTSQGRGDIRRKVCGRKSGTLTTSGHYHTHY